MAENIGALILPIGADASQFNRSINDVKAAFKELSNTIASTSFNFVTNEQKEQLNGLQRTLKTLNTDVKDFSKAFEFPENSIAGITRKIDELNKRKIALDANTSSQEIANLTQQIEKLIAKKNEINSLGKAIAEVFEAPANSIAGLDKRIAELSKRKINLDAKTSAVEIARLTKEIERLTAQKNNIDNLGQSISKIGKSSQAAFVKVQDSSKGARIALTSLSLVAQDLPFGFIGIQNNLPGVISSFGELTKTSGGVSGALGQLGQSLKGPAGIFLGFSVVTAAVTFLIQKYGSFGEAIDAITGRNKLLTESQKALNEAIASTTGNLTVENGKAQALISTLNNLKLPQNQRLAAYNELLTVQPEVLSGLSQENALTADGIALLNANNESLKERTRLKITEAGITSALNKAATTLAEKRLEETKLLAQEKVELDKYNKSLRDQPAAAKVAEQGINTYKLQLDNTRSSLKGVQDEIKNLETEQETYLNQLAPITNGIAGVNYQLKLKADNLKTEQKELQNSIDLNKKWAEQSRKSFENQPVIDSEQNFSRFVEGATRLNVKSVQDLVKANREGRLLITKELQTIPKININQQFIDQQQILASFALAKETIDNVFFNPLSSAFEKFLNTGRISFAEFGKIVLSNLKRLVAQIAATKIIEILAGLAGGPIAGAFSQGGSFLSNIGGLLPSLRQRSRFDNIRPSPFTNPGGTVNFVIRGTELVGVLNRGNQEINRIG
jgi:predicted  nucleic acid-binding Zn-ribbon protein